MQAVTPLWNEMPLHFGGSVVPSWVRNKEAFSFEQVYENTLARAVDTNPVTGLFRSSVDAVRQTDADLVREQYLLSTGQTDNPTNALIAATKAQLSVTMLVQLRNRALEAYNELMRMNV